MLEIADSLINLGLEEISSTIGIDIYVAKMIFMAAEKAVSIVDEGTSNQLMWLFHFFIYIQFYHYSFLSFLCNRLSHSGIHCCIRGIIVSGHFLYPHLDIVLKEFYCLETFNNFAADIPA
jgi:hypothetical protein